MMKNNELERNLKLSNIEVESVQFHLKMTKTELATCRSRLNEESQTRQNLEAEVGRLTEDLQHIASEKEEKCANLERDAGETKKLMWESRQSYKDLLTSQQEAFQRMTVECGRLNRALEAKEIEYRELELLERSMENQLSKALITIQKMDKKMKEGRTLQVPQTIVPKSHRRSSVFFHSISSDKEDDGRPRAPFNLIDIKSLYSADVEEQPAALLTGLESMEDVCTLSGTEVSEDSDD